MLIKSIDVFLVFSFFALSAPAAITCATAQKIESMSDIKAIDLAYKSGPNAGNYGFEPGQGEGSGIFFMSKENSIGNMAMLDMYPALNHEIFKFMGSSFDDTYKHNYSGIFQPTYLQSRECRRQLLITGTESGQIENPYTGNVIDGKYFTGWINVEICDPALLNLFKQASEFYDKESKSTKSENKMDDINKFLSFIDILEGKSEIPKQQATIIRSNLNTKNHPGVFYAKGKDGHIVPRFSLKIKHMYFEADGSECRMTVIPTSAYSGVLDVEEHTFSNQIQRAAYEQAQIGAEKLKTQTDIHKDDYKLYVESITQNEDGGLFIMSYWKDADTIGFKSAAINKTLNNP